MRAIESENVPVFSMNNSGLRVGREMEMSMTSGKKFEMREK